jgi:VWFA-related protein
MCRNPKPKADGSPPSGLPLGAMRLVRLLLLGLIGILSAAAAAAQEPVYSMKVDVGLVSLDVSVMDAQQQPIAGLRERDFTVYEDGTVQEIRHFSSLDTPYNILLLFDRSSSTQDQWRTMQRAASAFVGNLRKQDRIALASFEDGITMLSGWTASHSQVDRALDGLLRRGPGGGTNLYWSLERATQREFRGIEGRRAIIVWTDGRDNMLIRQTAAIGSPKSAKTDAGFQHTMTVLGGARIPVYFVALNTDRNPDDLGDEYYLLDNRFPASGAAKAFITETRKRIEMLADVSGGRVFYPKNLRQIVPVYDQISRDMSTAYSLGYISTHGSEQGHHTIEVRVRNGARVRQSRETYFTP